MAVDKNKVPAKVIQDNSETEVKKFPDVKSENKRQVFFYGMIAVDVFGYRNVENDSNLLSLESKIKEETGRSDGNFPNMYAERATYIRDMYFNFTEDVPQEYKNLEIWWEMVKQGTDASECYVWYIAHIPNYLTNMLGEAIDNAHTIWKPAAQRTIGLEKEAEKDPN